MTDFQLEFEKRAQYLFVKGKGVRKDFQAIIESTSELTKILTDNTSTFILLDYSEVITKTNNTDVFNLTRLYETRTPLLFQLCVSIVINPEEIGTEEFWEDICRQRGFNFKIFTKYMDAERWLLHEIGSESGA